MKRLAKTTLYFGLILLLQGCYSLHNSTLFDLEIVEPAKVIFPPGIDKIAVRNNNSRALCNSLQTSAPTKSAAIDADLHAASGYYNSFVGNLSESLLFDTVQIIAAPDFSKQKTQFGLPVESETIKPEHHKNSGVASLAKIYGDHCPEAKKLLNHQLGLYTTHINRLII